MCADARHGDEQDPAIGRWTGEFRDRDTESRFRLDRRGDERSNTRLIASMAAIGLVAATVVDLMDIGWGDHLAVLFVSRVLLLALLGLVATRSPRSETLLPVAAIGVYLSMVATVWLSEVNIPLLNISIAAMIIALEIFLAVPMRTRALVIGAIVVTYPVVVAARSEPSEVLPWELAAALVLTAGFGWFMAVAINDSLRADFLAAVKRRRLIADLEYEIERRTELEARLVHLAEFDGLTGIRNRRSFVERAQAALDAAVHAGRSTTVLIVDIDHFKSVNDTFGHAEGDAVLRDVALRLRDLETPGIVVGRLGGEEFGVACAGLDPHEALELAERFRMSIEGAEVGIADPGAHITVSIGLSSGGGPDLAAALHRADAALYEAKRGGRNRVEVHAFLAENVWLDASISDS